MFILKSLKSVYRPKTLETKSRIDVSIRLLDLILEEKSVGQS